MNTRHEHFLGRMTTCRPVFFILLGFAVAMALTACQNDLTGRIGQSEAEALAGKQLNPPDTGVPTGKVVTSWEDIVFTFDDTIVRSSLVIGGSLADDYGTVEWSTESLTDDTLTFKLATGTLWPLSVQNIVLSCRAESGESLVDQEYTWTVFNGMCIDASADASGAVGSSDHPFRTIQEGIDTAWAFYVDGGLTSTADVRVAEGLYEAVCDYLATYVAELEPGISIYGGYYDFFSERDIVNNPSVISDTSTSSGSATFFTPLSAIYCGSTITNSSRIDGFSITLPVYADTNPGVPGSSGYTAGIYCSEASPDIDGITITGPASMANEAYGIVLNKSTSVVSSCSITSISAELDAWGIVVRWGTDPSDVGPTISGNTISGITSVDDTGCLYLRGADTLVSGNSLTAGTGSLRRYGIYLRDTENGFDGPTITGNTITLGEGTGLFHYGLYERDTNSDPGIFSNNDFTDSDADFYRDQEAVELLIRSSNWSSGNVTIGGSSTGVTLPTMGNTKGL